MSVQVEPYQLRFLASRLSAGSQEMLLRANRLESIMNELVQGSWKGEGAHAFAIKCEVMKSEIQNAVEVLNNAIQTLNRFANQMDRVNQLRQQANMLEQQSWQYGGDSIDELHHRQNLARQAAQIRQEAEWEANAADSQAASEFQSIMTMIPQLMEQVSQYTGRNRNTGELDELPEPLRSYYLRHRGLLEDQSDDSVDSIAQLKENDEAYIQDHDQLLEAFKQYYFAKRPDWLSEQDREEAVQDDMIFLPELTNEQLYNRLQDLLANDERAEYYAKLVQQPDFEAKYQYKHDPGYQRFVQTNLAQSEGPGGLAYTGMGFAIGLMKALAPKYSRDTGASSGGGGGSEKKVESDSKLSEEGAAGGSSMIKSNLDEAESAGGHTLNRHVGKTDEQLIERIQNDTKIGGASSFTDKEIAQKVIDSCVVKYQEKIEQFLSTAKPGKKIVLSYDGDGSVLGRVIESGSNEVEDAKNALVVIKKTSVDGFVLTAYPKK